MKGSTAGRTTMGPGKRPWSARTLRITLGVRAAWNASFALYLLLQREQAVGPLIGAFVRYAYVDGVLALLVAGAHVVASPRRMLWLSPAVDALTRAALVAIVAVGPGVLDVPVTAVLYLGLLATFAVVDGGLDLLEGLSVEREPEYRSRWLPLSTSGLVAMTTGLVMFVADPGETLLRVMLVVLSLTHATTSAFGAPADRRTRWQGYDIALLLVGTVSLGCDRGESPLLDSTRSAITRDSVPAGPQEASRPLAERREAQRFLDSASAAIVAGDTGLAVALLHRGSALMLIQASAPHTSVADELLASAGEIDAYAGALARREHTSRVTLERLSARLNLAEAERHAVLASVAWSTSCKESICDELLMAVDHLERAAADGHIVLRQRTRALLAELRRLSVTLSTQSGIDLRTLDEPLARLQEEIEAMRRELALPRRPRDVVSGRPNVPTVRA